MTRKKKQFDKNKKQYDWDGILVKSPHAQIFVETPTPGNFVQQLWHKKLKLYRISGFHQNVEFESRTEITNGKLSSGIIIFHFGDDKILSATEMKKINIYRTRARQGKHLKTIACRKWKSRTFVQIGQWNVEP